MGGQPCHYSVRMKINLEVALPTVCCTICSRDDGVLPLQERIEAVSDDADLEEAYNTERHLLYVACTRARDHLLVTGVAPASEFLTDIKSPAKPARRP
jgi:ATP-dependent exoDNAse (exonuclease V) beta subunit